MRGGTLCTGLFVLACIPAGARAADSPGTTLRRYLDARWRGDVAAAQALWDPDDLRRTEAMGTSYPGLEARFDDNLLWSAADRAAAQARRPALGDSSVDAAWARYTVVVPHGAGADSLRYFLRKMADGWHVTAPFAHLTNGWTSRDTRFLRVRSTRLRDINSFALATLDADVQRACERLGVPEVARLRLERIKIEYYLCDSDATLRLLGVMPGSSRYRLAGERVVTRQVSDLQGISRALVHLALKESPPAVVPFLADGLPTALGGSTDASDGVWMQRGAALAAAASDPSLVFDAQARRQEKPEEALALSAAWSDALLRELGPERFAALYRKLSGTPEQVAALDGKAVRATIEAATGKSGPALLAWLRASSAKVIPPLASGCNSLPQESRTTQPILRWRDVEERWSLEGYDQGDRYVFTVGPYQGPVPAWAVHLADSLAQLAGKKPDASQQQAARGRPPGDPPQLAVLIRERLVLEPEAYESRLFAQQFTKRRYATDLYGLFVGPGEARLYDYRRDVLVGTSAPALAATGATPYYDEKAGRICFSLDAKSFLKPLGDYMVLVFPYTGE